LQHDGADGAGGADDGKRGLGHRRHLPVPA
jgi:hypothetical protein